MTTELYIKKIERILSTSSLRILKGPFSSHIKCLILFDNTTRVSLEISLSLFREINLPRRFFCRPVFHYLAHSVELKINKLSVGQMTMNCFGNVSMQWSDSWLTMISSVRVIISRWYLYLSVRRGREGKVAIVVVNHREIRARDLLWFRIFNDTSKSSGVKSFIPGHCLTNFTDNKPSSHYHVHRAISRAHILGKLCWCDCGAEVNLCDAWRGCRALIIRYWSCRVLCVLRKLVGWNKVCCLGDRRSFSTEQIFRLFRLLPLFIAEELRCE